MSKERNFRKPTITFDQLARMPEIPEIPEELKSKLWSTIKVKREVKITEESEHFVNIMCIHFGLNRNQIINHAINTLWREVVQSITMERLKLYEEKVEIMRLFRLQQKEARQVRIAERKQQSLDAFKEQNPEVVIKETNECSYWTYRNNQK